MPFIIIVRSFIAQDFWTFSIIYVFAFSRIVSDKPAINVIIWFRNEKLMLSQIREYNKISLSKVLSERGRVWNCSAILTSGNY